jgi:hypothetical protein
VDFVPTLVHPPYFPGRDCGLLRFLRASGAAILPVTDLREEAMRRAARAATIGFAALAVFEAALAAGAPLGDAAWGGSAAQLTTGQRVASAATAVFWIAAIAVVRRRATGRTERRYRWGTWGLVALLGVSAVVNVASGSAWENYLLAPVGLVLAGLCAVVASNARGAARDARPLAAGARAKRPLPVSDR